MKNLNLIKRLWTDSHEKQKPQRFARYAAMLMMLLTLGVGQMWGNIKFYYGETTEPVYLHIWNAGSSDNTSWDNKKSMTKVPGTTNVWYYEMHDNDNDFYVIFCKSQSGDGKFNSNDIHITSDCNGKKYNSSETSGSPYTPPTVYSVTVSTESSSKGTISAPASSPTSVVEDGSLTITASEKSGYYFTSWTASPAGNATFANANKISTTATITGNVTITAHFTSSLQEALIAGSYIMVYGGELTGWNKTEYYFMYTKSTSNKAAIATKDVYPISINNEAYWFGAVALQPGTYYHGHENWAPNFSCEIAAGNAYLIRNGSPSSTYFERKAGSDNADALYRVKKAGSTDPTYSVSTTIDAEVICGGNISVLSGDPGVSSIGLSNTLVYYLYNGSTWSTLTVSEGVANVSALSVGEGYKIVTFLYDGHIYVKADEDEFEVIEATGHTITYTTQSTGWTYGTKPTAAEKDATVTFEVIPTDGYSVTVESEDVTLTKDGNEYTFTMPDNDVEITVSASPKNYAITYSPASAPIGAVYTTTPANANYGSTVNLTIDRWAGYSTSVSVKDEDDGNVSVTNATSRTPSFTMPAKSVTVTVTATKINKPIVYVLKTNVAAGSNIENFSSVSSDADNVLFWGWGNGGTDNFYTSSASWNSNVQLSDARVGTYIDEHGNTWYEFISNRSTFNLSTEYMVILRLKDTRNLYESNADGHWVDGTECNSSTNTYFKGITWIVPNGKTSEHSAQLYTSNPDGITRASIASVDLSLSRVPPLAPITATPTMYDVVGVGEKAYCWGVYTDEDCTNQVTSVSFTSLGDGRVQFAAPQAERTYYLKLTVRASAACDAAIDDEKVVSFTVSTSQMVFFKNVPGWGNVHFYFLGGDYWDNDKGAGCENRDGGSARGMTRIGNSNVYYYDYSGNSVMTTYLSSHSSCYIAFTDNYKPNSKNFSGCQAAYRGDFSDCATMYVPENHITDYKNTSAGDGQAAYYNRGYWTNYMSTRSGFALCLWDKTANNADGEIRIDSVELVSDKAGSNTYVYTYDFGDEDNHKANLPYTYGFKLVGCGGSYYGADDDMMVDKCTDWNLYTGTRKCGLNVLAALPHSLIITLSGDGKIRVDAEYPLNVGDYRLLYDDNTQNPHPSQFIRKRANGKDTVAMFIRPSETENLKVQYCSSIVGETITWSDYEWDSGSAAINVADKEDGVYNFYLEQDGSKNLTVKTSATEPYSGKYYIRTSVVDGGWNSYKSTSDNLMTYAQYPDDRGYGFNYYKAKWVEATGSDVTYTIACDYSPSLSDTLVADPGNNPLSAAEARSLPHSANIRFGWHSKTNQLKREYINGSTNISDRYLVMIGDSKLMNPDETPLAISGLNANEISFTDLNNWIYRCDVKAQEGAAVRLVANYDGHTQDFIGSEGEPEEIIGGTGSEKYVMRVTYDFKTNRLMTAWLPSGNIDKDMTLKADMLLIRKGQNAATQVHFTEAYSISEIHTIYGVLEFQYDSIAGKFSSWSSPNAYKYLMYYLSFPFEVKVSEIFGCGVRGTNWIIQKYNGAKRAQIGWFAETSTFWETLPGDSVLHPNEGYLLILDRISFNDASSSLWYKQGSGNSIYLYFPSTSATSGTISESTATIKVPKHTCTINRSFYVDEKIGTVNHKNTDSHWNVIGTPLFENKTATTIAPPAPDGDGATTLQYYYAWDYDDNSLIARSALTTSTVFKSMHGYMVQYAGDITFTGAKLTPPPASVAARHMPSDKKNYLIELKMVNENGKSSDAYVELRENACDTFALNEDMYMMRSSSKADLYTFAGNYDVAANVLSMNNHIVPVGMDVKRAGTYRFTMPSEFSGTVTLIDTETGVRTNLALSDYEVALPKGTSNTRFLLEIDINKMPTAIDGVDGGSLKDGKAHKFIQNGQMYILKDGIIYDARGNRLQ